MNYSTPTVPGTSGESMKYVASPGDMCVVYGDRMQFDPATLGAGFFMVNEKTGDAYSIKEQGKKSATSITFKAVEGTYYLSGKRGP